MSPELALDVSRVNTDGSYLRLAASTPPGGAYRAPGQAGISFDGFIRAAVVVRHLSDSFRRADSDGDGWANLSYDQFLAIVLGCP